MKIELTREQEEWLSAQAAKGGLASLSDALRQVIDERIAEERDDLAWALPLVNEARQAMERGEVITLDEHRERNRERLRRDGS